MHTVLQCRCFASSAAAVVTSSLHGSIIQQQRQLPTNDTGSNILSFIQMGMVSMRLLPRMDHVLWVEQENIGGIGGNDTIGWTVGLTCGRFAESLRKLFRWRAAALLTRLAWKRERDRKRDWLPATPAFVPGCMDSCYSNMTLHSFSPAVIWSVFALASLQPPCFSPGMSRHCRFLTCTPLHCSHLCSTDNT